LIDTLGNAVLCSFSLARVCLEATQTDVFVPSVGGRGRMRFVAPEITHGEDPCSGSASDIFSLAMTFFSFWTREIPFAEMHEFGALVEIGRGRRPTKPTAQIGLPPEMEEEFWLLLEEMWARDPSMRPSSEIVQERLEKMFAPLLEQHGKVISSPPSTGSWFIRFQSIDRYRFT
jgi:hypothetical protein